MSDSFDDTPFELDCFEFVLPKRSANNAPMSDEGAGVVGSHRSCRSS